MKHQITFLILLFSSCYNSPSINQQVHYHDSGLSKPKVAIIKVIDNTEKNLPWELDSEFTELLIKELYSQSKLFLTDDFHMIKGDQLKKLELSPCSQDMSWLLEVNTSSEFLLFTEILKHEFIDTPKKTYNPLSYVKSLQASVRVCVLDIRCKQPKIILQEIVTKTYPIPFQIGSYKNDSSTFDRTSFAISPLGLAHKRLISEISRHVEDYVLLAQSKHQPTETF